MIDSYGRIKGRVSIVDIVLVVAVIGLLVGFLHTRTSERIGQIWRPDTQFEIVFQIDRTRHFIADAVSEGDLMFREHDRTALGRVIKVERLPAWDYFDHRDGTVTREPMELRYTLRITIEAVGSVTERGYFINGMDHLANGSGVRLASNMVLMPTARVYLIRQV